MAKKFAELEARMAPEARAQAQALYLQHLKELPLHELRKAQELSQEALAKKLHINQAAVSKWSDAQTCISAPCAITFRPWGASLKLSRPLRMVR